MATPQETLDQLMQDATDFHSWFTAEEAATLTNSEGVEIKNLAQIIDDIQQLDIEQLDIESGAILALKNHLLEQEKSIIPFFQDDALILDQDRKILLKKNPDGSLDFSFNLSEKQEQQLGILNQEKGLIPFFNPSVVQDVNGVSLIDFLHNRLDFSAPIKARHYSDELVGIILSGQSYFHLNGNNGNYSYPNGSPANSDTLMFDDGYDVTGGGYEDAPDVGVRFIPIVERDGIQSVAGPIAYQLSYLQNQKQSGMLQFVARSCAVGGARVQELLPDTDADHIPNDIGTSYPFGNFQLTIKKFFTEAKRLGKKPRVIIPFCQGNANRNSSFEQSYDLTTKLFEYYRNEIAIYTDEKPLFLIVPPPFSGRGDPYYVAQAQMQIAHDFDDVKLAANGSSGVRHDGLHFSDAGALDVGVLIANAINHHLHHIEYTAPHIILNSAEIVGNEIHLHVGGQDVQLEIKNLSTLNSYDGLNPIDNYGVQWVGSENITSVKVLPRLIKVKFDADMSTATGEIKVAYQTDWGMNGGVNPEDGGSPSRSNIRSVESIFNPFAKEYIHSYLCPFKQAFTNGE